MALPNGNDDDSSRLAALLGGESIARLELELLFLLPPPTLLELEQLLQQVPPPEPLMAPSQEPPFEVAPPPMLADAPVTYTLPAAAGDPPLAPAADVYAADDEDDGFPRNGSYLLEVADAILDDGSGRQATDEDVDRLLREHGLESFIKPKQPM